MPERDARVLPLHDEAHVARALFKRLALAVDARPLAPSEHRKLRERVLRSSREARAPCRTRTLRASESAWRSLVAGVDFRLLHADPAGGTMTAFIRMLPGSTFEAHEHPCTEECLVLEGEIRIGSHRLVAGDMHVANGGTRHDTTHSAGGALLWVRAALPAGLCDA